MIKVINGSLYQWDLNRSVEVDDPENKISAIHFCHKGDEDALVVPFSKDEGKVRANIPNILLQSSDEIYVFVVYTESEEVKTEEHKLFYVFPRQKPSDYVYEESEVLSYKALEKELRKSLERKADLDENGKVKKEQLPSDISASPFVITLTTDENGEYTSNKTGEEILTAFNEDGRLVCDTQANFHIPFSRRTLNVKSSSLCYGFVFHSSYEKSYVTVVINVHRSSKEILSISVTEGNYDEQKSGKLLINGQVYDGSDSLWVDTREFVFNATITDEESGECEINVNPADFITALNSGRTMICDFHGFRLNLRAVAPTQNNTATEFTFLESLGGTYWAYCLVTLSDNHLSAIGEIGMIDLTINGEVWDGMEPKDFTDTINNMIDDKIPSNEELAGLKILLI